MAFDKAYLKLKKNNPRGIPDEYTYWGRDDTIAEITSAGYFDESAFAPKEDPRRNLTDPPDTDAYAIHVQASDGPYEVQLVGGVASVSPPQKYASDDLNLNIAKLLATDLQPTWDRSQFDTAIASGSCTVTFVGTSITVGTAENENSNTWVNRFKRYMEYKYPSVDFTWYNLALGGRNLVNYNNASFQGQASEPGDPSTGYYVAANPDTWPNGSTVGQSWKDAAEATAPNLFVLAQGMNDRDYPYIYQNYLNTAINDALSWTTAPSILLVTEMLPVADFTGFSQVSRLSDYVRWYAMYNGYGLLDVGRAWKAARYNVDPVKTVAKRQDSISDWTQSGGAMTLTDDSITVTGGTNGVITKEGDYAGARFSFTFTPVNNQADWLIQTAVYTGDPDNGCIHIERVGGNINIRKRPVAGVEQNFATAAPVASTPEEWDIRVNRVWIAIYRDGSLVGKFVHKQTDTVGNISFGLNTASATNIVCDLEEQATPFAAQLATDAFLLGGPEQGDWQNGDYSVGGNSLNHPSRLAVANVFDPVIRDWIAKL